MAEKRLAVVTGAARGIGRAIVFELLQQGRLVAGLDVIEDQLADLQEAVKKAGFEVITRCVDITDTPRFTEVLEALASEHGGIGILVNNAGITRDNLLMRMKDEDWQAILDTNLTSVYRASKAVMRGMMKARRGRIVNIASVIGVTGNAGQANYAAAKAGIIAFSKSLAKEIGSRGISGRSRWSGWASRPTSRARWPSSRGPAPATSPARHCTSTAACTWPDSTACRCLRRPAFT